jgi:predicted regulator of Ras-like GTPase activity (Roadblock/LC7/MglB family)
MTAGRAEWEGDLRRVTTAVAELESSLAAFDLDAGTRAADALVTASDGLLLLIRAHPERDGERLAELAAALDVFRNAAFAFRGLSDKGEPDTALAATCSTLIEQGNDHLQRFTEGSLAE